jgi:uncharacterized phage protein gp47/JayE
MTTFVCANQRRLLAVKLAGVENGIEYLEVRDHDEPNPDLRQRTLFVRLLLPVPTTLSTANVVIDGGERIEKVMVEWAKAATALTAAEAADLLTGIDEIDRVLVVRTLEPGDFSRYRFALVAAGADQPPAGFDPLLGEVAFSFTVECPSEFDCRLPCTCPPGVHHPPQIDAAPIDYLAKDYDGFRRLMLERMSLLAPDWTERSSADVGVAVVELLAYVADELSYRQDAVATEAYLDTARSRISLRRHARLVDYRVHDGSAARAWLRVTVNSSGIELPAGSVVFSQPDSGRGAAELAPRLSPTAFAAADRSRLVIFRTVDDVVLDEDLGELRLWSWGAQDACLPIGATSATLRRFHPALRAGDVIVLAETISPLTGDAADADPARRQAVRLVEVTQRIDPAGALFPDGETEVTDIRWHADDALQRELRLDVAGRDTAMAWGNIVLADHGAVVADENLGEVPAARLTRLADDCADEQQPIPPRFRPALLSKPLTRSVVAAAVPLTVVPLVATVAAELTSGSSGDGLQAIFDRVGIVLPDNSIIRGSSPRWSVSAFGRAWVLRERVGMLELLPQEPSVLALSAAGPERAVPALSVTGLDGNGVQPWAAQDDLLSSGRQDRDFTVETEHDLTAILRFGDDAHGSRPAEGTVFTATYRVGNGTVGNVGRDALTHIVSSDSGIDGVTNPLPAWGGTDPETADEIRRNAPAAFAVQQRAVTPDDYAEMAMRASTVSKAAATFRWTGSWHTAFVTADRFGTAVVDGPFETSLRSSLEPYRMAGYDLEVDGPVFVPLEIALHVCLAGGFHRSDVALALRAVLSSSVGPDGRPGLFHPDGITFGQPIYLSAVLAAAHSVPGVESVDVHSFQRQREPQSSAIDSGVLEMGRLEIARLDNDPNYPECGVLSLAFGGGS